MTKYGGKRLVGALFFLVAALVALFSLTAHGAAEDKARGVKILTDAPAVGKPITAEATGTEGEVRYVWTSGGEPVGENAPTYTPAPSDYERFLTVTATDGLGTVGTARIYFSKLPVVYLDTEVGRDKIDHYDYSHAELFIQGSAAYPAAYRGGTDIRGRGNSSWIQPKKPYKLKLDEKTDLYGFGKSKHYVLLANYLDPSLLRGEIAFELSRAAGMVTPDSVFVDLVMDGEYVGNYVLAEHVRFGDQLIAAQDLEELTEDVAKAVRKGAGLTKDEGAVLEDEMAADLSWLTSGEVTFGGATYRVADYYEMPGNVYGAYLLEFDTKNRGEPLAFETEGGIRVIVSSPENLDTNQKLFDYVKNYVQLAEDSVKSPDGYAGSGEHYTAYVDLDSIVLYWLLLEVLSNEDSASRSRIATLDAGGKITFGPVWDFDIGGGSYRSFYGAKGLHVTGEIIGLTTGQDFFKEFCDDPLFQTRAREWYYRLRPLFDDIVRDGGRIDALSEYLYESAVANEILWCGYGKMPRLFSGEYGDLAIYKDYLSRRLAWFDTVFDTAEHTTHTLTTSLAHDPYRVSDEITFTPLSGGTDARWGVVLTAGEDLSFAAAIPGNCAILYLDGLRYATYTKEQLAAGVTVPRADLREMPGGVSVLSLSSEAAGKTARNFLTVRTAGEPLPLVLTGSDRIPDLCAGEHTLIPVTGREASDGEYGLHPCLFCTACERYFDGAGNLLPAATVVTSPKCATFAISMRSYSISAVFLLVAVPLGTALLVKRRKRKKRKAEKKGAVAFRCRIVRFRPRRRTLVR